MVRSTSSCAVNVARRMSLLLLLMQYAQSYMQKFVSMIFNNETHRPSSVKLWQIPIPPTVLPKPSDWFFLTVPLEEQETSYLADSARIFNLLSIVSFILLQSNKFRVKNYPEKILNLPFVLINSITV